MKTKNKIRLKENVSDKNEIITIENATFQSWGRFYCI